MTIDTSLFRGANILITGVTGSLGSALSRELLKPEYGVKRLAGLARKWQPMVELQRALNDARFRPLIGDITDSVRLDIAMREVDFVWHCAAFKDQVLAQYEPRTVVSVNIIGTMNVLHAAMEAGVKRVMFVSSDKATAPSGSYGASKLVGEILSTAYNIYSGIDGTRFASCKYGNVFGSSGSVVPLFLSQRDSGVITITDGDMTRFWITMEQAVGLVIRGMVEMVGGEVFVPHLPASNVFDLAKAIAPDAEIKLVGLRPGEKRNEMMISENESHRTEDIGWAYRIRPEQVFWDATAKFPAGSPVPNGWEYGSASAPRLTVEEIRSMLPSANLQK